MVLTQARLVRLKLRCTWNERDELQCILRQDDEDNKMDKVYCKEAAIINNLCEIIHSFLSKTRCLVFMPDILFIRF